MKFNRWELNNKKEDIIRCKLVIRNIDDIDFPSDETHHNNIRESIKEIYSILQMKE